MRDKYVILKDCTPNDLQYAVNKSVEKGYEPCGPLVQFEGYLLQPMILNPDYKD